jgi:hypothetical protein
MRYSASTPYASSDAYTSDPVFSEPHAGPLVVCGNGYTSGERDPSPEQIARMTAVIRSTWTVGQMMHRSGAAPVNEESQPTHIPHGLPVEVLKLKPTRDFY